MTAQDWIGILVPFKDCKEAYRTIFKKLEITDVIQIENSVHPLTESTE